MPGSRQFSVVVWGSELVAALTSRCKSNPYLHVQGHLVAGGSGVGSTGVGAGVGGYFYYIEHNDSMFVELCTKWLIWQYHTDTADKR